jgi:hypothetical protein
LIVVLYLTTLSKTKHYLLIDEANKIKGIYFFRDDEDWFAIRVDKNSQGSGKGSLLMEELKKNKDSLNGLVVDHENDVKQKRKSTINRPCCFMSKMDFMKK